MKNKDLVKDLKDTLKKYLLFYSILISYTFVLAVYLALETIWSWAMVLPLTLLLTCKLILIYRFEVKK